jgi:hypothetical protein
LLELQDALPADEAAFLEDARDRIFNDPAAWIALSQAFDKKAEACEARAVEARKIFADAARDYLLKSKAVEISWISLDLADPLALRVAQTRETLNGILAAANQATVKGNLCRHIGNGQQPGAEDTFEKIAALLDFTIPALV